MTITRAQVADLQSGDVVEYGNASYGWTITGALWENPDGALMVGNCVVRHPDGNPPSLLSRTLTVVFRAPRPLYVNHPRTEPVPGDVFQPECSQWPIWVAGHAQIAEHKSAESCRWIGRGSLPARLRLLVDGETGQVVQ